MYCTRCVQNKSCPQNEILSQVSDPIQRCELKSTQGAKNNTMAQSRTLAANNTNVQQINQDMMHYVESDKSYSDQVHGENSHRHVNGNKSTQVISEPDKDNVCDESSSHNTSASNIKSTCDTNGSHCISGKKAPNPLRDLQFTGIFDTNNVASDKYINMLCRGVHKLNKMQNIKECSVSVKWKQQTDFDFGFVPQSDFIMPEQNNVTTNAVDCPIAQHFIVKQTQVPNFLGTRIPIRSQLNVDKWHQYLSEYWDQQLLQLVTYGFPLDFNRQCVLKTDKTNHASALKYPADIEAYLKEEKQYQAVLGPFKENSIPSCHYSPFMTKKSRVLSICALSLTFHGPQENSVNSGIHKDLY